MEVLISFLTKRKSGNISSRDYEVPCEVVRFGRGTDNEVQLPDPRIPISQAVLQKRPEGLHFESNGTAVVRVDGKDIRTGIVVVGTVIDMGPYEIKLVEPPKGTDVAITVQLVRPLGVGLEQLKAHSKTELSDTWLLKRQFSWALFFVILGLFLVWPIAGFYLGPGEQVALKTPIAAARTSRRVWPMAGDLAWDTGELSKPHKLLAGQCTTCHRKPFERVTDAVCAACHPKVTHHVNTADYMFPELTDARCQSCHKEHLGPTPIITRGQKFCVDCHGSLKQIAKETPLLNVRDFGDNHPQFRPMIVIDAKQNKRQRMALDQVNWPKEQTALKFSHKQHLVPKGMRTPDKTERKVLQCADCHKLHPNGITMVKVRMESHCQECHRLQFEPLRPKRVVPHGKPERVMTSLREFYGAVALTGGADFKGAPPSVRRRPGTPLTTAQRLEAMAWARARTEQTAEHVFRKSLCNTCHVVSGKAGKNGTLWDIEPVSIPERWMPKALFDHRAHETTTCTDCHDAPASASTTDVLLPQIETCQACHGGEKAITGVPSTCVMCHVFHQPNLGPMRPNLAASTRPNG